MNNVFFCRSAFGMCLYLFKYGFNVYNYKLRRNT